MEDRIGPAYVTDNDTGTKYELDFNRESILYSENHGFDSDKPRKSVEDLFYYAFRMHHRNVPREKIDKLREKWGGMPESLLNRLTDLYKQAQTTGLVQSDEDAAKNAAVTLEL